MWTLKDFKQEVTLEIQNKSKEENTPLKAQISFILLTARQISGLISGTFPLAIYGRIDTASRKILWLKIWVTNSDPQRIKYWYLEYLYETRI